MNVLANSPHLTNLESLLQLVIRPSPDQLTHITSLTNLLSSNEVSKVFTEAANAADSDNQRITTLVTNIVKVPDRTINMIGIDQATLPSFLYPRQYCSMLLRNLATSLNMLLAIPPPTFNPTMFSWTIQQLLLTHSEQLQSSHQFWQFLAKWTLTNKLAGAELSQAIMTNLDIGGLEKCLLAVVRHVRHPLAVQRIFGCCLTLPGKYTLLLNLLFVRGLADSTPASVTCLLGYLARVERSKLEQLLVKGIRVWSDEVEIDHGEYTHQLGLAWMICASLGHLEQEQVEKVRDVATRVLMGGMVHWLEAAVDKRVLGMSVATVVLGRLGGSVPEWSVGDQQLLDQLTCLAEGEMELVEKEYEVDLVKLWEMNNEDTLVNEMSKTVITTVKVIKEKVTVNDNCNRETLDSDDDDDDDLPAYDMSADTPSTKEVVPIHYLREVLDHLADPESVQHEECLSFIPKLSSTHLKHEDPSLVAELLQLVLCIHNKYDTPGWADLRQTAITSVVQARPVPASRCLVRAVYDRENTLDTKFAIIDCLVAGGSQLREEGSALLGEFLSLTVGGLCVGGGGTWGRMQVSGLDTSILTHTLLGVSSLIRLGEHTNTWEGQVTDCLEFLLAVAGGGKRPVQAAVLHGLGVVAALIPPHILARGRVGQLVAEGAQWAGQLTGEMREAGENMRSMIGYKHQEAARIQMERDLAQPRELKMRVDKNSVKIK